MTASQVWSRIESHAGEVFRQIRGREFTYEVTGSRVILHTTNRQIPRKDFEEAFRYLPLKNTTTIRHLQGPSYIFAILSDERITGTK